MNPASGRSEALPQGDTDQITEAVISPAIQSPFARAFTNPGEKPFIGLIIGGLGTSKAQTMSAINELPPEITLSFVPETDTALIRHARRMGHEVLIEIPMETYERKNQGIQRHILSPTTSPNENIRRLNIHLRSKPEIYGVINQGGDKFMAMRGATSQILKHIKDQDKVFLQHALTPNTRLGVEAREHELGYAAARYHIDTEKEAGYIDRQLFALETEAIKNGHVLATGTAYPLTIDHVIAWSEKLKEKNILLSPASAIIAQNSKPGQIESVMTASMAETLRIDQ